MEKTVGKNNWKKQLVEQLGASSWEQLGAVGSSWDEQLGRDELGAVGTSSWRKHLGTPTNNTWGHPQTGNAKPPSLPFSNLGGAVEQEKGVRYRLRQKEVNGT